MSHRRKRTGEKRGIKVGMWFEGGWCANLLDSGDKLRRGATHRRVRGCPAFLHRPPPEGPDPLSPEKARAAACVSGAEGSEERERLREVGSALGAFAL